MQKILLLTAFMATFLIGNAQIQNYSVGEVVNDFTVTDTDGNTHNLYEYTAAGKHVVLDFFFTTCPPCQQTVAYFNELYDKYGCNQGDLICLEINTGQDNDAAVEQYSATYGGSFNHSPAVSGDGGSEAVDLDFNPTAYPTYCMIGPDNTLLESDIWPIANVADFESAFPAGFEPEELACTVNISENSKQDYTASVYPNPVADQLHVVIDGNTNNVGVSIDIFNLLGELVTNYNNVQFENDFAIPVKNFENGIYLAQVTTTDGFKKTIQFKVIK